MTKNNTKGNALINRPKLRYKSEELINPTTDWYTIPSKTNGANKIKTDFTKFM